MKHKILFSTFVAILLLAATSALVLAWPDQPPDKVVISGPGIEGQVEVKDKQALAIFRLGTLEDLHSESPLPPNSPAPVEFGAGYKIVRYFDSEFDFARLTYYPDPKGGRGYLYWQDGPMLQGDHTPYNLTWLSAKPDAESKLRALLAQLSEKPDTAASANAVTSSNANTAASGVQGNQPSNAPSTATNAVASSAMTIGLLIAAVAVLGTAGILLLRRARRV